MTAPASVTQPEFLELARMLKPHAPLGKHKRRFGGRNDGGYVLIDDFSGIDHALSFGIDHNVSWDLDLARRGIPVTQYDHTIDRSPSEHPRIAFVRKKIVPSEVGDETSTVEAALQSAAFTTPPRQYGRSTLRVMSGLFLARAIQPRSRVSLRLSSSFTIFRMHPIERGSKRRARRYGKSRSASP